MKPKLMKEALKFLSSNRNFLILGLLLVSLPVLLVLSQTHQVFSPMAVNPADPAVVDINLSGTTSYNPGQTIHATVAIQNAGHFDAFYINADTNPTPNVSSSFTAIPELTNRPNGGNDWVVPTTPGHYFFAVNVHKNPGHSNDDWNPALGDVGCAWDGFIYQTNLNPPPVVIQPTPPQPCANLGLKAFSVGVVSTASPSPGGSVVASSSPSVSPSPIIIASRPPRAVPFQPTNLAADCIESDFVCLSKDPIKLTGSLYAIGLGLVGGVGVLFMIIGAYIVLTSQGDPTKVSKGKEYITYSIVGILLALFGYAFYQIIAVDILKLPGFSN